MKKYGVEKWNRMREEFNVLMCNEFVNTSAVFSFHVKWSSRAQKHSTKVNNSVYK